MSFEPLDLTPIIDRIRSEIPDMEEVGGAAEYSAVMDLVSFRTPSSYVVLAQEKDLTQATEKPGRRPSGRQQLESTFGVIMALRNYRDPEGEAVSAEARQMIGKVRAQLMGWTPDKTEFARLWFQQGDVLDYNDNTLLWIDVYNTTHYIGGTA